MYFSDIRPAHDVLFAPHVQAALSIYGHHTAELAVYTVLAGAAYTVLAGAVYTVLAEAAYTVLAGAAYIVLAGAAVEPRVAVKTEAYRQQVAVPFCLYEPDMLPNLYFEYGF